MGLEEWRGRAAVVTGAGSGFGAAITRLLARLGMKIVAADLNLDAVQGIVESVKNSSESGCEIFAVRCNVAKETDVKELFATAKEKLGGVDVSIQCAGLSRPAPLLTGDAADWRIMQEVNVDGVMFCCREAVNVMRQNGVDDGVLINLVSLAAHNWTRYRDLHYYGATKAMLLCLQEGFRQELREIGSNIRISGICPGQGKTGLWSSMFEGKEDWSVKMIEKQLDPEDIADVVKYILGTPKHVQVHDVLLRPVIQN